jgi:hypothetical protein
LEPPHVPHVLGRAAPRAIDFPGIELGRASFPAAEADIEDFAAPGPIAGLQIDDRHSIDTTCWPAWKRRIIVFSPLCRHR